MNQRSSALNSPLRPLRLCGKSAIRNWIIRNSQWIELRHDVQRRHIPGGPQACANGSSQASINRSLRPEGSRAGGDGQAVPPHPAGPGKRRRQGGKSRIPLEEWLAKAGSDRCNPTWRNANKLTPFLSRACPIPLVSLSTENESAIFRSKRWDCQGDMLIGWKTGARGSSNCELRIANCGLKT